MMDLTLELIEQYRAGWLHVPRMAFYQTLIDFLITSLIATTTATTTISVIICCGVCSHFFLHNSNFDMRDQAICDVVVILSTFLSLFRWNCYPFFHYLVIICTPLKHSHFFSHSHHRTPNYAPRRTFLSTLDWLLNYKRPPSCTQDNVLLRLQAISGSERPQSTWSTLSYLLKIELVPIFIVKMFKQNWQSMISF